MIESESAENSEFPPQVNHVSPSRNEYIEERIVEILPDLRRNVTNAWEEFYQLTKTLYFTIALNKLVRWGFSRDFAIQRAEEVLHEAYINIYKSIQTFDEDFKSTSTKTKFINWSGKILANATQDTIRKESLLENSEFQYPEDQTDFMEIYASKGSPLDQNLLSEENRQIIKITLSLLPEEDRQLIKMIYFEQLPIKIVASKLHMTPAGVYKKRTRLMEKIRQLLKNQDH